MNIKYILKGFIIAVVSVIAISCDDFLNRSSSTIFSDEEIFKDASMIKSVLAGFYAGLDYEPTWSSPQGFGLLDEATQYEGKTDTKYGYTLWRAYPYTAIRNINIFIKNLSDTKVLTEEEKKQYIAEMKVLRAWHYFCMARSLGGMPIVGDTVYNITDNVGGMRLPRSTEAGIYDYVISECTNAANVLSAETGAANHCTRVNKWVALALKARAAIYAGSIAKYNNLVTPQIKTSGMEVGIPAGMAEKYYRTAKEAAWEIINSKKYGLYNKEDDKAYNFYKAMIDKNNNPEIIWSKDYLYPNAVNSWSVNAVPTAVSLTLTNNEITPLLNLVESYERLDGSNPEIKTKQLNGDYVFYDSPEEPFRNRDPRLHGTIICPGDMFLNTKIVYQAGQMQQQGKKWKKIVKSVGTNDADGDIITSLNGPEETGGAWWSNKTGFNFCKFVETNAENRNPSHGGETWTIRFRYAEVLLIYAEACLELHEESEGLPYLNQVRDRAGVPSLQSYDIKTIEHERRVEFPLENQRFWDMKRWRRAHMVWDGTSDSSIQWGLFPYHIKDRRSKHNGKWVFEKIPSVSMPKARTFELANYYSFIDDNMLKNNPKLVKNPYQ